MSPPECFVIKIRHWTRDRLCSASRLYLPWTSFVIDKAEAWISSCNMTFLACCVCRAVLLTPPMSLLVAVWTKKGFQQLCVYYRYNAETTVYTVLEMCRATVVKSNIRPVSCHISVLSATTPWALFRIWIWSSEGFCLLPFFTWRRQQNPVSETL
jgi:hypothetical protein